MKQLLYILLFLPLFCNAQFAGYIAPQGWCTLDASSTGFHGVNWTFSGGNLVGSVTAAAVSVSLSNYGARTGKWYWEITITSMGSFVYVGFATTGINLGAILGNDRYGWGYASGSGTNHNNAVAAYGASYAAGAVIGIALDIDGGTCTFYKTGVSQGATGAAFNVGIQTGTYFYAAVANYTSTSAATFTCNFGASAFTGTVPAGYTPGLGYLNENKN